MKANPLFWDDLEATNKTLYELVRIIFHYYKYPDPKGEPRGMQQEYRYGALVRTDWQAVETSVFAYVGIVTGEVTFKRGRWEIQTTKGEARRRDAFLADLDAIKVNHPDGYRFDPYKPTKDEETVYGELASLLDMYHPKPSRLSAFLTRNTH